MAEVVKEKLSFFERLKRAFVILFLLTCLLCLFIGIVIFFDFIGMINIKGLIPPNIAKIPIVRRYIEASMQNLLTEEERIKIGIEKQEKEFKKQKFLLKQRYLELQKMEKRLNEMVLDIKKRENKLLKERNIFEKEKLKFKKEVESYYNLEKRLEKLAKYYEKMDSAQAAKRLAKLDVALITKIFMKMRERIISKILENMDTDKAVEITKHMGRTRL